MIDSNLLVALLFTAFAAIGAWSDARARTIPNVLSVVFAITGLAAMWFIGGAAAAGSAFLHLLVALVAGMVIYSLSMWGGGDAKFYAASAAWFTLSDLPLLALSISVAGLLLLTVWFVVRRVIRPAAKRRGGGELPYGVAIAGGGIAIMVAQAL